MLLAERLLSRLLLQESVLPEPLEDALGDLGMLLRWRATEVVEPDLEPVIHFLMDLVIFCAELLRRYPLLQCLSFGRSTVFIRSTYEERRSSAGFVVSAVLLASKSQTGRQWARDTLRRRPHSARSRRCSPGEEHC